MRSALIRLLDFYEVQIPVFNTPGLGREDWLKQQTRCIQHLCKRSVKNSTARWKAMACLDNVETQVED